MHAFALGLILSFAPPSVPAHADTARVRYATLEGWDRRVRLAAWDRSHAAGGIYTDRGAMQRWTRAMDHEYDLDLFTTLPTPADDAAFYAAPNGVRTSAGSITTGHFATETELQVAVPLTRRLRLGARFVQQEDLSARRGAVELSYLVDVGRGHRLGARHSLGEFKSDLDAELVYRYAGRVTGEATVGRLDVANNFIYATLVPSSYHDDTLRVYEAAPYWATGRVSVPLGRVRVEATGGASPRSRAAVRSQTVPEAQFHYDSRFAYGGALVEAEIAEGRTGGLVVGALASGLRTGTARRTPPGIAAVAGYAAWQSEARLGVFALGRWRTFHAEAWWARERRTDRQDGQAFAGAALNSAYSIDERWTWVRLRADWQPGRRRGPTLGAEFAQSLRSFPAPGDRQEVRQVLAFGPYGPSRRVTARAGWRFSPAAEVVVGASADLDLDLFLERTDRRYDSAHVRFRATW